MTLSYTTVTGAFLDSSGKPHTGSVQFRPTADLTDLTGDHYISSDPVTVTLDAAGQISVPLAATDSANVLPAGWNYTVVVTLGSQSASFSTGLPSSPSTADITQLMPAGFSVTGNSGGAGPAGTPGVSYLPLAGGTMSGPVAMGSSKITGLANGTAAQDAAAFGQIPPLSQLDARYALLAGAVMAGKFVTQVPNIVFDGDSLTNGTGSLPFNNFPASNDFPSQVVAGLDPAGTYYNIGVGGEQVATMITNAPTAVDARLVTGANNIVVFAGGSNDLQSTDNATTTYNRIVTYCQARQAAGWKVIVSTITPRSDAGVPADFDTLRLSVNTSIRANWATFANGLADIGADALMGTSGQETNTQYYNGDLVHHNPNGYHRRAMLVLAALKTLGVTGASLRSRAALLSDLWIPASQFSLSSGSPAVSVANLWPCWNLSHASTDAIIGGTVLPRDWLSFAAVVAWTQTGGGSGNVAWRLDTMPGYAGSNTTSVTAGAQTNVAVPASGIMAWSALTGTTYNASQGGAPRIIQGFRLVRLGASGSDTYTSAAQFTGLYLYRAS